MYHMGGILVYHSTICPISTYVAIHNDILHSPLCLKGMITLRVVDESLQIFEKHVLVQ